MQGPFHAGLIDLCQSNTHEYDGLVTIISFDFLTGQYTFDSNDHVTFLPGDYHFQVSITVGDLTEVTTFIMTLHTPCGGSELVITQIPESHYYYVVGDPMLFVF